MKASYSSAKSMLQLARSLQSRPADVVSIILLGFSRQQLVSSVQQLVFQLRYTCSYYSCMLSDIDICCSAWRACFHAFMAAAVHTCICCLLAFMAAAVHACICCLLLPEALNLWCFILTEFVNPNSEHF